MGPRALAFPLSPGLSEDDSIQPYCLLLAGGSGGGAVIMV